MNKYKIVYTEGNVINKKVIIESNTLIEALMIFLQENTNAVYESIEAHKDG